MVKRLFQVVDDQPVVVPLLINLPPFKKLWEEDKSDDKSLLKKQLMYIYHSCDYSSPYYEIDNREAKLKKEYFGSETYKINKTMQACIDEYKERNTVSEQKYLDSIIDICDGILSNMNRFTAENSLLQKIVEEIDNAIEDPKNTMDIKIDLMKQKMDLQDKYLSITKGASDLVPRMQKNIQALLDTRELVENKLMGLNDSNSKSVENFIIDSFITKYE